jgi:hypothetical protein
MRESTSASQASASHAAATFLPRRVLAAMSASSKNSRCAVAQHNVAVIKLSSRPSRCRNERVIRVHAHARIE